MNGWDGTYIARPVVDRGISQWSTMAEELEKALPQLTAEVEACLATAPWGPGAEGDAFCQAHFRDNGPMEMLTQCTRLARGITDAGDRLRQAIDNTLQTDADIRHDLTAMTREV
ncbi:hypothetical protein [Nonomuraea sp. NPDC049709]|uniref:hypothetical protein n=1 Tax=Nonomuraea sp. NPDC049709 TaxID=3154736 RepID=UPI0034145FFD